MQTHWKNIHCTCYVLSHDTNFISTHDFRASVSQQDSWPASDYEDDLLTAKVCFKFKIVCSHLHVQSMVIVLHVRLCDVFVYSSLCLVVGFAG